MRASAFWSALVFALLPGVVFSTRIISTDVPLLFCWALALLAFVKLLRGPDRRWAWVLGGAIGFGLLAKYAMAYFLAGMAIAALFDRASRDVVMRRQTWLALVLALVILSPNILWNVLNGFVTLKHTGDNIQGSGFKLSPLGALEFIATQFGVAGPLLFGGFLVALARWRSSAITREDRLMLAFAIPPLAAVTALGFLRNVNANWAAAAFVSTTIIVVAMWMREGRTQDSWRDACDRPDRASGAARGRRGRLSGRHRIARRERRLLSPHARLARPRRSRRTESARGKCENGRRRRPA